MERSRAEGGGGFSFPAPRVRTWPQNRGSRTAGPRSRSGPTGRSHSPQHGAARVKQERDDRCRRGNEEQRRPSQQQPRRHGSAEPDRHRDRSDTKKNPRDRPGARGRERDRQNLWEQRAQRELCNERRREHRQGTEGRGDHSESKPKEKAVVSKEKPSFELSGALLEDTNTFRGVVIRYSEPPEARIPKTRWRLYPFRNEELLPVLYIHRQSAYLLGRHRRTAGIPIDPPSCSRQLALFQYRQAECPGLPAPRHAG